MFVYYDELHCYDTLVTKCGHRYRLRFLHDPLPIITALLLLPYSFA
jgi:hypothetical protein